MLELRAITKAYTTASLTQTALDEVSVAFRDSEFVAVLGQSGSGKTTMLNVIGGLDQFDSGDLLIDGISTRDYSDRDWDAYRNNRIGFVFQSYNLIPHQSVLANVELALTLSGVSPAERRQRATDALVEVGLEDHLHKKPSQLSGGQMQRVAIARALVNDPEILLADEPTGALDSSTSLQVMDLLRDVARDRLVVMVTHNPDLAEQYATRTVELCDGRIIADTDPFDPAEAELRDAKEVRKTSMGWLTAISLSFNNLMTKKGRTIMTAFAGSIGIIGIAAILALANGVNDYIDRTEEEALTAYPLQIQKVGMDMSAAMEGHGKPPEDDANGGDAAKGGAAGAGGGGAAGDGDGGGGAAGDGAAGTGMPGEGTIETSGEFTALLGSTRTNDLKSLKAFFDDNGGGIKDHTAAIEYHYDVKPRIFQGDTTGGIVQVNPDQAFENIYQGPTGNPFAAMMGADSFQQMPNKAELYRDQYDVKAGRWATGTDELVLVLGTSGRLPEVLSYTLGLRDHAELEAYMNNDMAAVASSTDDKDSGVVTTEGEDGETTSYTYQQLMDVPFKLVPAQAQYQYDSSYGVWTDRRDDEAYMRQAVEDGMPLRIVGIVQAKEDDKMTLRRGLAYTPALTRHVMNEAANSEIVKQQLAKPDVDVFTGRTFEDLAKGEGGREFDMASMFSIDAQKLKAAFGMDPSKMQMDLGAMDFAAMPMPDFSKMPMDFSGMSAGTLDPSAFAGALDPGALDVSRLTLDQLTAQYPQLADVDLAGIIRDSLADGVIKEEAGRALSGTVGTLVADYFTFAQERIAAAPDLDGDGVPDVDTDALISEYLAQPQVQQAIAEVLASEDVIDQEKFIANLTQRLGDDPAIQSVAKDVRDQLVAQIGAQLGAAVAGVVQDTLADMMTSVMSSVMTQMMGTLQTQIQTQLQSVMGGFAGAMASGMNIDPKAFMEAFQFNVNPEELSALLATMMTRTVTTYDGNLATLNYASADDPNLIDIYPMSFEEKDEVLAILDKYNADAEAAGDEDRVIVYTDLVGLLMSSVTDIINIITWMLIAFVSISLVVSSIMIAIITYISVLERRKEIGILRAIGASKQSVRHVFNAETFLEGLMAGVLGVVVTWLLTIPANAIVSAKFDVDRIAVLPIGAALILIAISVVLTVFAGLIPAAKAAREDPVEALRSE